MFKYLKKRAVSLALLAIIFLSAIQLSAASRKSYIQKSYSIKSYKKKSYSKKAPYAGYGEPSKINGLPKNKIITGHIKTTNKGYTYVNPYARSK